jgi:hypothetical protein
MVSFVRFSCAASYGEQQVLEIILGLSQKSSNYTNHIANTPVDGAFQNSLGKIK